MIIVVGQNIHQGSGILLGVIKMKKIYINFLIVSFLLVGVLAVSLSNFEVNPKLNSTIMSYYVEGNFLHINYSYDGVEKKMTFISQEYFDSKYYTAELENRTLDEVYLDYINNQINFTLSENVLVEAKRRYWNDTYGIDIEFDNDPWNKIVMAIAEQSKNMSLELCKLGSEKYC